MNKHIINIEEAQPLDYCYKPNNFLSPVKYTITSKFGWRHIFAKADFHNGTDLGTPIGTPVLAAAFGTIVSIWNDHLGGLSMRVKLEAGPIIGMCHLSKTYGKVGQDVHQGDILARTGNTGNTTGAHLHLTVQENGQFQDPELYFNFI